MISHCDSLNFLQWLGRSLPAHRLSIIGPIVAISRSSFASVYSTICTKSDVIAYKNSYKQPLYFGIPGVVEGSILAAIVFSIC